MKGFAVQGLAEGPKAPAACVRSKTETRAQLALVALKNQAALLAALAALLLVACCLAP